MQTSHFTDVFFPQVHNVQQHEAYPGGEVLVARQSLDTCEILIHPTLGGGGEKEDGFWIKL